MTHDHSNGVPTDGHDHGTVAPPVTEPYPVPIEAASLIRTMAALYAKDKAQDVQEMAYKDEVESGLRAALSASQAEVAELKQKVAALEAKIGKESATTA